MPSTTLTIDQIEISRLNVRTRPRPAEAGDALAASIAEHGLRNPLQVHPIAGKLKGGRDRWGVIDGSRRYRAIRALVQAGTLPADWPVPVLTHESLSDAELVELSIDANEPGLREDLYPDELAAAIARAVKLGHDADTIARRVSGFDRREVARWERLGRLAPAIFTALLVQPDDADPDEVADALDLARAYAATEDQALQLAVWERLSALPLYLHTPHAVRTAMKIGDREQTRLLTFVGEAVYRAAGGGWELDIFADSAADRGRLAHPEILARLVEEKLASVRDQARAATEEPELRFVPEPPQDRGYTDHQLEVKPRSEGDRLALPTRRKGEIVAHVEIDGAGQPRVTFWWESRAAKYGNEKPTAPVSAGPIEKPADAPPQPRGLKEGIAINDAASPGEAKRAAGFIREEEGVAGDSLQVARSLRKHALRGMLIENARAGDDVATDYLVWAQLRMLAGGFAAAISAAQVGMRAISTGYEPGVSTALTRIRDACAEQPARRVIDDALFELTNQTFFTGEDLGDAFLDYRASGDRLKQLAAAVVAGLALERSLNADGFRLAAHDAVAAEIVGPDDPGELHRRHWTPTASFLAMLPKPQLLRIAADFVDEKTHAAWGKLKAAELVDEVARVLAGAHPSIRADAREAAARWVHPLLRFDPPPRDPVDDEEDHNANDRIREAAE